MKRGEEIVLDIERFADRGKSLARLEGMVVFVPGVVPGDRVRARFSKVTRSYSEARPLEILEYSKLRTEPLCRYFGVCGGCSWQHVSYEAQLQAKHEAVVGALAHTGGFKDVQVRPTLGSEATYYYRNKMEYTFGAQRWLMTDEIAGGEQVDRSFAAGLHIPGNFFKILDVRECHLQPQFSINILNAVRTFAVARGWEPWDVRSQSGFLRHLVIRHGEHTGEIMVNLLTSRHEPDEMTALGEHLRTQFPEITTFVNGITDRVSMVAYGDETHTIYGSGVIHDRIGRYDFEIAPNAFFQTNTRQAERLYDVARTFARLQPEDHVYDLYCGAGTISLYVSDAVQHVVGVELIEAAIQNAKTSAERNGVTNCTFVAGDLMRMFTSDFVRRHGRPDVLITDPPRNGMHPRVVESIYELRPERIVYVSCNPQTQARDLAMLADQYQIDAVQPVDLFPHTYHIENVVALSQKGSRWAHQPL